MDKGIDTCERVYRDISKTFFIYYSSLYNTIFLYLNISYYYYIINSKNLYLLYIY